jgi:diguanylate cyclase (GGDEF)-like protein/PAS domain S-box-containing protein
VSAPARELLPTPAAVARAWAAQVEGTSYVSMSRPSLVGYLTELAARILDAFTADTFDRSVPHGVGCALVGVHFTEAVSLERTVAVLGDQLAGAVQGREAATRLAAVQGALAAGYAQALQDRTRGEQQRISAAAFAARTAAEQARWASEARFEAVFAEAAIGIGIADVDGRIVEVNRAMCDMLGYTADEFRRRPVWEFIHPTDTPGIWDQVKELLAGATDHLRHEKAYYRKDGAQIWTDLVLSLVRDPQGRPRYVVAMIEDITERHELQLRLHHQATHDPLTGLPNRTLFFERLTAALEADTAGTRLGVCYLDLDGFKVVNDTLGHDAGDRLLQAVADRLATALRAEGHLVARMGGDEFVVLVERSGGLDHLRRVAEAALDTVRQPVHLDGHHIVVSASVGVVERDDGGGGAAELMKAADTTLYWAKKDGRDRYALFDSDRHRTDVSRFELSSRMREALARGEFAVEYQPLVRLTDERTIGVEALVRWRLPDGQRLGPGAFIPLAEETGLIVPLGRWVLTEACRQARSWRDAHPSAELLMSVNMAARQMREPTVVADVAAILEATGWPAHALQLELTETDVMGTTAGSLETLHSLADMGVRIAIDDFGTGYSNLAYLRSLPVHTLKLAGPFVTGRRSGGSGRGGEEMDHEILAALISLAHTLGLTVTAEYVETIQQRDRLRSLGCDAGQGWLFGPAAGPDSILPLLRGAAPGTGRLR